VIEAERVAKAHGCVAVQGTCFSFQAPGLFRKLGYEAFGTADVLLDGHTQDYLIKQLQGVGCLQQRAMSGPGRPKPQIAP